LQARDVFLQPLVLLQQLLQFFTDFFRRGVDQARDSRQQGITILNVFQGVLTCHGFDTPHTRCHRAFLGYFEQANLPGVLRVRAAAQFHRRWVAV